MGSLRICNNIVGIQEQWNNDLSVSPLNFAYWCILYILFHNLFCSKKKEKKCHYSGQYPFQVTAIQVCDTCGSCEVCILHMIPQVSDNLIFTSTLYILLCTLFYFLDGEKTSRSSINNILNWRYCIYYVSDH